MRFGVGMNTDHTLEEVEHYGQMSEVNEEDFDLICNDCKGKNNEN